MRTLLLLFLSIFTVTASAGKIIQLPGNDAYDDVSIPNPILGIARSGLSTHTVHVKGEIAFEADISDWMLTSSGGHGTIIELKTYPDKQAILALDALKIGVRSCGFHQCLDDFMRIVFVIPRTLKTRAGIAEKDGKSLAEYVRDVLISPKRYNYTPLLPDTQSLSEQDQIFFVDSKFRETHYVLEVTPAHFAEIERFYLNP